LTRILRPCLGGKSLTFILTTINPRRENFDQTLNALRFAQRAMKITNDTTTLIHMAPLHTFKFALDYKTWVGGLPELYDAAFQRGLADGFQVAIGGAGNILAATEEEIAAVAEEVKTLQHVYLAHDRFSGLKRLMDAQGSREFESVKTTEAADALSTATIRLKRARTLKQEAELEEQHERDRLGEKLREHRSALADKRFLLDEARASRVTDVMVVCEWERATRAALVADERDAFNNFLAEYATTLQANKPLVGNKEDMLKQYRDRLVSLKTQLAELDCALEMATDEIVTREGVMDTAPLASGSFGVDHQFTSMQQAQLRNFKKPMMTSTNGFVASLLKASIRLLPQRPRRQLRASASLSCPVPCHQLRPAALVPLRFQAARASPPPLQWPHIQ